MKFDFIIVGAGSAGCVLAARLSEHAGFNVLLLEAGNSDNSPTVQIPTGAVTIVPTTHKNWAFHTSPQAGLNDRTGYQPRGKVLGGSSSINAMVYIRGHQADYDDWADLGWGWQEVLPYFKKAERNEHGADALHGDAGPLYVSNSRSMHSVADDFVRAGVALGYPHNLDFNGPSQHGLGRYQLTQKNGLRCSAAKAYLAPVRFRRNLTVMTDCQATSLIMDGTKCIGVEVQHRKQKKRLFASKEVLLSAGAFGSPQLLLLSGIGPVDKLSPFEIKQHHILPGVGENLQDHPDYVSTYYSSNPTTFGLSMRGSWHLLKHLWRLAVNRDGIFTSNFAETGGFVKTDQTLERPDIQFHFVIASVRDHARDWRTSLHHGISCHTCVLRPKSIGNLTLGSADPVAPPRINPNFLADKDDLNRLRKGVRIANTVLAHERMAQHKLTALDREFDMDDDELNHHLRNKTDTVYHPIGTCKMGQATDPMAVVDPTLKVIGLSGLRVVDASVFPNLIGGNTNAPTIMLAERASDMIKQDHR